jgi:hypothetical protein
MNRVKDNGGTVLLWLVTAALIVFTAARSVHLIQSTMPAEFSMLAYAALAGLDIGVLAWLFWTTRTAHAGVQRTIGTLMIVVDLAGIAVAVLGDTMLVADAGSKELVSTAAIWIVPIVIVSNIAATIVAHATDPAQELRDAQRALTDELEYQKAEYLRANAATLAAKVAAQQGQHEADQMIAKFQSGANAGTFSNNGKGNGPVAAFAAEGTVPAKAKASRPKGGASS